MDGKEPRPPEDWDDSVEAGPPSGNATSETDATGTIGGPASEH